ncbi:MAG: F0F1 ATP synthase subunit A [Clostridia bacterium]|nr:F0F1 ATP synthase subunit A [Clostridia bacterium]
MEVNVTGARILFEIPILGGIPITETLVTTWIVMALIVGVCLYLTHNLKVRPESRRQIVAEYLVSAANNLVVGNMGERFRYYAPFIASLFAMSTLCSLSSLTGLFAPTADLNTVLAWAVLSFVLITYYKVKTNGWKEYGKGFLKPIFIMAPLNVISEIATPMSMAFRHFGNIASGMVISALVYGALAVLSHTLFAWLPGALSQIPFLQVGLPAVLSIYFDLFSGVIQAFIFCMLTMNFIAMAADPGEDA